MILSWEKWRGSWSQWINHCGTGLLVLLHSHRVLPTIIMKTEKVSEMPMNCLDILGSFMSVVCITWKLPFTSKLWPLKLLGVYNLETLLLLFYILFLLRVGEKWSPFMGVLYTDRGLNYSDIKVISQFSYYYIWRVAEPPLNDEGVVQTF